MRIWSLMHRRNLHEQFEKGRYRLYCGPWEYQEYVLKTYLRVIADSVRPRKPDIVLPLCTRSPSRGISGEELWRS